MYIQSLDIEHFGKFKNLSLSLNPGFNVLTGANEAGKTTLACFIKAMLFGMGQEEQEKYLPFDRDGVYGGSISVSQDGHLYRISRSFLAGEEKLSVEDTALGSDAEDPEALLGSLLGGFDRESFESAGFISEGSFFMDGQTWKHTPEKDRLREKQLSSSLTKEEGTEKNAQRDELARTKEEAGALLEELLECRVAYRDAQVRANALRKGEDTPEKSEEPEDKLPVLKQQLEEVIGQTEGKKPSQNAVGTALLVLAALAALSAWFTSRANGQWTVFSMGATAAGLLFVLLGVVFTVRSILKNRKLAYYRRVEEALREKVETAEAEITRAEAAAEKKTESERLLSETESLLREIADKAERLSAELREKNGRIQELETLIGQETAGETAGETAEEAFSGDVSAIRGESEEATRWLQKLTGGDRRVELFGGELRVFESDGREMPERALSQAVRQSICLAIRLARAGRGTLPLVLDDIFANFDGDRLHTALSALGSIDGQIILLSCQKREQMEF